MSQFLQDLRYGGRLLLKKPGFLAVSVITLALGIGANTAIFSVINALLLSPLPYPDPERVVMVWEKRPREGVMDNVVSPRDFVDWRARNQVFEAMAAQIEAPLDLSGQGEPARLYAGNVSASFFDVLGVQPEIGRNFLPEEEQPGRNRVVILNNSLWRSRFGADPGVIGTTIQLSGIPFEVIGVLPASFRFSNQDLELWFPLNMSSEQMQTRVNHFLFVYARTKPGVSVEQARAEMDQLGEQLMSEFPRENNGHSAHVVALHEQLVGTLRKSLILLFAAVGMVLLIACANVANLLLVRAAGRHKEIAIRAALGARRSRIVGQFLNESMFLALLGGTVGALLSLWAVDLLGLFVPPGLLQLNDVKLDLRTLGFTLAISLLTGLLFGLAAAWQTSKPDLNESLKEGGRDSAVSRSHLRSAFVVAEVAIALILLTGAGLLIRSFLKLQAVDPGFDPRQVLTARVSLPGARYRDFKQSTAFFEELLKRTRELPGVKAASATALLPLGGGDSRSGIVVEGREPVPNEPTRAHPRAVMSDYFEVMGMRLVEGRVLSEQDTADTPLVVMVNETAANRYWPGLSPVGRRMRFAGGEEWREIVGIVGDVKYWGLSKPVNPEWYLPYSQLPRADMTIVARTTGAPEATAPALREELRRMDPALPLSNVRTMEQVIEGSVESPRSYMLLVMIFAGVALILSAIGIYGVMSYSVAQRTHEIGVRLALGASRSDVMRLVVGQGLKLAAIGVATGWAGAWALTRLMSSLLFEVSAFDLVTFGGVALVLSLVALLACQLPARRASKVDPMVALRYE